MEKDLRDKRVIELHNSGDSIRTIASSLGISKSNVSNIISAYLETGEVKPKVLSRVKLDGDEEVFSSFVGYERTDINEYVHKETGEMVRIVFVKAKKSGDFGHFVKLK